MGFNSKFVVLFTGCKTKAQRLKKFEKELEERFDKEFPSTFRDGASLMVRLQKLHAVTEEKAIWDVTYVPGRMKDGRPVADTGWARII